MPDTTMNPLELEAQHAAGFFRPRGITLVRGEGAYVFDDAGRRYLDGTAAYGVASLGHSHPKVVEALQRQAATLTSVSVTSPTGPGA